MSLPELLANSPIPGVDAPLALLANNGGALTAGATSLHTSAAASAPLQAAGQFRILIDQELMLVTGGASSQLWTVTRGVEGTAAVSHRDGIPIYHKLTAGALDARYPHVGTDGTIGGAGGTALNAVVEITTHKDQANGYAGLDSGGLLKVPELPGAVELNTHKDQANGYAGLDGNALLKVAELPSSVVTDSRGSGAGADVPMNGHTLTGLGPLVLPGGTIGQFADFSTGAPGSPLAATDVPSSTPFDSVQVAAGGALTYDGTTVLAPMTRSMKVATTAAATAIVLWGSAGKLAYTTFGRAYINMAALPAANWRLLLWQQGGTSCGFIRVTTGGVVNIGDQSGNVVASSTALSTGTWYRFEWSMTRSAGAGIVTLNIYAGHSTTPLQTLVSTGFATGTYIDKIEFGNANNSNVGSSGLYIAGFADGCVAAPGPYTAPPSPIAEARSPDGSVDYGGFQYDGQFVMRARSDSTDGNAHYKYRAGGAMVRVDKYGNVIYGPSLLAVPGSPLSSLSVPDAAYDVASRRFGARGFYATETNDVPSLGLTRFGNKNNDRSGSDGTTNGAIFTSATVAFKSIDVNKSIVVGGTTYYITSVDSPTQAHLENADGSAAAFGVASGVAWSTSYHPYPSLLDGVGANCGVGRLRATPGSYAVLRSGSDAVVNGTTTLTSAAAAFTAADTGRQIMLNNDVTRIYTLTYVNATTVTLDTADPNTASGVSWKIAGQQGDGGAVPSQSDAGVFGFLTEGAPTVWDSATGNYMPTSAYLALGAKALLASGAPAPLVMRWRADGRVEIPNRLTLTDPALTDLNNVAAMNGAPTDTQIWRSAAARESHNGLIDATALGIASKVKAGTPVDGDWASAPPNGTIVADSSGLAVWVRIAGSWVRFGTALELAYAQITANVSVTGTTAAAATDLGLTTGAITYDGNPVMIECYTPQAGKGTNSIQIVLYDGATQLGNMGIYQAASSSETFKTRITPSAGSHTYLPKAFVDAGTGSFGAGDGAAGHQVPAYFRITRAS